MLVWLIRFCESWLSLFFLLVMLFKKKVWVLLVELFFWYWFFVNGVDPFHMCVYGVDADPFEF